MRNESDVRKWLAAVQGAPITWIEAGRGGTMGAPDAMLHADINLPIELKFWQCAAKGKFWLAKMRPVQVRYHYVMNESRIRTLLLWSDDQSGNVVYAMGGQHAPRKASSHLSFGDSNIRKYYNGEQARLLADVNALAFWPSATATFKQEHATCP